MIRWVFVCLCFFSFHLDAKKYNLSVCSLFKNEAENLKEWIEYHRLIGVDHFYLYDNGSSDRYLGVLRPYIRQKLVTLMKWPDLVKKEAGDKLSHWVLATQIPAYENVIALYAKDETKWLVFLDVDEFLLPVKEDSVPKLLEKYEDSPGVAVSHQNFDASMEAQSLEKRLVIESEDITAQSEKDIRETVRKVIFKPNCYAGSTWSPYECLFQDGRQAVLVDREVIRVNQYEKRKQIVKKPRRKLYTSKKVLKESEIKELLDAGYDIADGSKPIQRFIPELSFRMNLK